MPAPPITAVTGPAVPLLLDDIDTDRIIPARFLRCVTFDGLGDHAFEDDKEQDPSHPFNDDLFADATVLVSGRNFGCGSSREHAPQSLMRWGLKGIVAESFAEIFFGNCTGLGIPCVRAPREVLERLAEVAADPARVPITVDVESKTVSAGGESFPVEIADGARDALLGGRYDFLSEMLEAGEAIETSASRLPYLNAFE
ncbi:MAG: 3-isopropylmalate dehydratase small subunit [Planctomycetota bacterium]